jgi:hypothetical protein
MPVGPLKLEMLDSSSRLLHQMSSTVMVQAKEPREINFIRLIQSSTLPGVQVNFTFTIDQLRSFKHENGTEIIPWVKITLPDCVTVVTGFSLQVFDHASGMIKEHRQLTA